MALKIRLTRLGAVHNPNYRIVVVEARPRRDGAPVEQLGTYQPCNKGEQVKVDLARVDYWIAKGAKPTDTLNAVIKRARKAAAVTA